MAIKESALSLITSIAQGDWIRAVTSAGASRRVTVANLAKAIVESYTGSSLGGYNQSVKDAIDSLNTKTTDTLVVPSGWSVGNNFCAKKAGIVSFYLEVTNGTLNSGWNTIGTLPVGYRPPNAFDTLIVDNGSSGAPIAQGKVTSAGLVQVYKSSTTTNNLRAYVVFMV